MSNVPEEVGKVATVAIGGFRDNPLCLAAVVLAAFFGLLTFWAYQKDADRRAKTADILLDKCIPYVQEIRPEDHPPRTEGVKP